LYVVKSSIKHEVVELIITSTQLPH